MTSSLARKGWAELKRALNLFFHPVRRLPPVLLALILCSLIGLFVDAAVEILIQSDSLDLQRLALVPAEGYQHLLTGGRVPHVRRTAVVEINPDREFPDVSMLNPCEERALLSELLRRLATVHPSVIVVDKYFVASTCPPNDRGTEALLHTIRALRKDGQPIVVGRAAGAVPAASSNYEVQSLAYLEPSLAFDGNAQEGLLNLARDTRLLPLEWTLYAGEDQRTVIRKESLALVAAKRAGLRPDLDPRLTRLISRSEMPLIAFVGVEQWYRAEAHFYASDILCGRATPPVRWQSCVAAEAAVPGPLAGKIVLIGEASPIDIHSTVVGNVPGVYLQANYIEALLDGRYLVPAGSLASYGVGIGFVFFASQILLHLSKWGSALLMGGLCLATLLLLSITVNIFGYYIDPLPISTMILAAFLSMLFAHQKPSRHVR